MDASTRDCGSGTTGNMAEQQIIESQHRMWLENTPYLYDTVMIETLERPTSTVQWLPPLFRAESYYTVHRLLLSASTSADQNHLIIANVLLPTDEAQILALRFKNARDFDANPLQGKFFVDARIIHEGRIKRARCMPQCADMLATKSSIPDVLVFNPKKCRPEPDDTTCKPLLRLRGHSKGGRCLSWNPAREGHLLSASDDLSICIWDVQAATSESNVLDAQIIINRHNTSVNDVDWHRSCETVFGSVGDCGKLMIWDIRSKLDKLCLSADAHSTDVNCITFCPFSDYELATGSADKTVAVWDWRSLKSSLYTLRSHKGEIYNVQWSPHNGRILASTAADRRLHLWDLSKIGGTQSPEDAVDGPPELIFVHGGHTSRIIDFSWNSKEPGFLCSVSEDNVVQIWQAAEEIYNRKSKYL